MTWLKLAAVLAAVLTGPAIVVGLAVTARRDWKRDRLRDLSRDRCSCDPCACQCWELWR